MMGRVVKQVYGSGGKTFEVNEEVTGGTASPIKHCTRGQRGHG